MLLSIQNFESIPEVAKLAIHNKSGHKSDTYHLVAAPGESPDHRPERQPGAAHGRRGWRPGHPRDGAGQPPVRRLRPLYDLVFFNHHQPRPHLPQVQQYKVDLSK